MFSRKWMTGLLIAGFFSVILMDQLQSQQEPPGSGQRDRGQGRARLDPQQMQQRMLERMKENLAVTESEWTVIEPKLTAVMTLSREVNIRGMRGFGRGGRGGPGGPGGQVGQRRGQGPGAGETGQSSRPQSEIEKNAAALQSILENESSSAEQIKKSLATLRTAREKSKQKLAKAQEDLRKALTVRQEAQLVLMGYLD